MSRIGNRILILISLILCSFFCFQIGRDYQTGREREQVLDEVKQSVIAKEEPDTLFQIDWAGLQQINPDIVAWLYVPDCNISYPVVQAADNSAYLAYNFHGQYDEFGTPFLDSSARADFSSDNSIIYAHSTTRTGMFTDLKNFEDGEFFQSHPAFYLMTPQANYRVSILAFVRTTYDNPFYNTDFGSDGEAIIQNLLAQALYARPELSHERLISLSTCDMAYGLDSPYRLVLTGSMEQVAEVRYETAAK